LRESESKYRDLFENANGLIQSADADGKCIQANRKWLKTPGCTEQEISCLAFTDVLRRDQSPHCMELFKKFSSDASIAHRGAVFVAKAGREVVVEGKASVRFEEGTFAASRGLKRRESWTIFQNRFRQKTFQEN
jgi:PAS domain S-box-containing protein